MSSPFSKLIEISPEERGGSTAANRFNYQISWAFLQLLQLQESTENYVLVLDYHDDIIICKPDRQDKIFEFYQIKSGTNKNWTLKTLTHRKSVTTHSILGKLYRHFMVFADQVNSINFITNTAYSIPSKLNSEAHSEQSEAKNPLRTVAEFSVADLDDAAVISMETVLKTEHNLIDCSAASVPFRFGTTLLCPKTHVDLAKGKLSDFLENFCNDIQIGSSNVYRCISEELRTRANFEQECSSVSDLLAHKAYSRADFEARINRIASSLRPEKWDAIHKSLLQEGVSFFRIKQLKADWQIIKLLALDPDNTMLKHATHVIRQVMEAHPPSEVSTPLLTYIETIRQEAQSVFVTEQIQLSDSETTAIIIDSL